MRLITYLKNTCLRKDLSMEGSGSGKTYLVYQQTNDILSFIGFSKPKLQMAWATEHQANEYCKSMNRNCSWDSVYFYDIVTLER